MEGEFGPEPLEHSVLDIHLDSQPRHDVLDSGWLEHSVTVRAPSGGAVLYQNMTVSDLLEHSGMRTSDDSVGRWSIADGGYDGPSAIRMYAESRLGASASGGTTLGRPAGGHRVLIGN